MGGNIRRKMSRIIRIICSSSLVCKLKRGFIDVLRWFLKKGKYKLELDAGTNNLLLNFIDFIFLLLYCALSGYNVIRTFDLNKAPSYLVFTLNILNLLRYYIQNKVIIRDAKNAYLAKNGGNLENLNVVSSGIRTIFESGSLCISMFFILVGRIFDTDILGIRSASVVAIVSIIIVIFTFIEEINRIAINMFKAEPKVYIDSEKEGDQKC